jgi:FkbM family methyltransferase
MNLHRFPNAVGPEQTDAPVYFLHIPKTAGLTLSTFLGSLYLDSEFWHRGGERWTWESMLKWTPEELRHCQIINGHFAGYLFKHYPLPLRYFTLVRDPLSRAVSHYEHVLRDKTHYFHGLAQELGTFGAYLRDERTQPTIVNFQLRCLGATFDPVEVAKTLTPGQIAQGELEKHLDTMPLDRPVEELLQTAQARLDQMFFVGLTERFEESLSLLCEIFSWPRPAMIGASNVNPRARSVKDLPSADLRLLERLNEADIELYQRAKARFERDWARSRFVYPQLHAFVSYAQNAEDVLLHRALRDINQGTYVDVGANDPSGDSVTKAFYDRGWRGINIEPVTSLYDALVKQRPDDVNIQAAAGAADAKETLYEIPGTGLSTLDASIAERHRAQGFKVDETHVRVRTLHSILAETPRPDIHFLKIDVEGWERKVLQGTNLSATRPWIIVIEATEPNTEVPSYREWEPLLLEHEYSFVFFDGLNRYYLARERQALKKAFSRPVNSADAFIKASEASAVRALRHVQWNLRRESVLLHNRAQSAEAHANALERERDGLRHEVTAQVSARDFERKSAIEQIEALTLWATSADTYGKSLVTECEALRVALKEENEAREAEREARARSKAERNELDKSLKALEGRFTELQRHWAVRLLVNKRNFSSKPALSVERTPKRKIGVFTIASKNYLAYVRVLLKSVAVLHPEYALYLCLADKVDGAFDPREEGFHVVPSDGIGIPHFDDMSVRYDIMEFNTAIKPFMFRWLLDNTDLDSVIYLDPDIRAFSRFSHLEAVLASDVSVVLTPHITQPVEDGKNPNDYHMLQAGVFNLGFAAVNRCDEAKRFVEWWGRRLETQADADFARNLFTDQRWCDLAPCFLGRLHILKHPGYNVAYWNLTEQAIRQVRGEWQANGEPLTFFHFSGVNASKENVISKHQNRFDWTDVPTCKPMFDAYRQALLQEGWEQSKGWEYAYAYTKEGLRIPPIARKLYRLSFPTSQTFADTSATGRLLGLCNESSNTVPFDFARPITRLMDIIYRERQDLQAAYNLNTHEGRTGFRAWYASTASREYNLSLEFVPHISPMEAETLLSGVPGMSDKGVHTTAADRLAVIGGALAPQALATYSVNDTLDLDEAWERLPITVRRLLAPAVNRVLSAPTYHSADEIGFKPPGTGRIDALLRPAPLPALLGDHRYISILMHMIWTSRPDLRVAFALDTPDGQTAFANWFEQSAKREYGFDGRMPVHPELDEVGKISPFESTMTASVPGANLIGYAHAELGMGEHVRMSAAALEGTSVQFGVVNFDVGVASRQGATLEHGEVIPDNRFAANIFHINADQMFIAYCRLGREFFANKYNIGYWAWELAKCPADWLPVLKMMDEVWAPSRFIQQAFVERADIPVEYMPLCVTLPEFNRLDRRHFDLPDRAFMFLYAFDFFSFLDRKNPFAAIRAFKRAFPEGKSDVCLVLKVMNGKDESPLWVNMMQLIDGDPRIVVINRTLNRNEMLALLDTSDCFLSLHRSEGFGRGPAEAMYLGKPVIVTNYSGNTDFTLADNSCLVDFKLIPVEDGQYPCHQGQRWADADVEHAAWYMKKLYADRAYASDLGARGKAYIHENFNQRTVGAIYESRLKKLGLA